MIAFILKVVFTIIGIIGAVFVALVVSSNTENIADITMDIKDVERDIEWLKNECVSIRIRIYDIEHGEDSEQNDIRKPFA